MLKNNQKRDFLNTSDENHRKKGCHVSSHVQDIDTQTIYQTLITETYWAKDLTQEQFFLMKNLSTFHVLFQAQNLQTGFARVISDGVYVAYLCDVFIKKEWRHRGFGTFLVRSVLEDPKYTHVKKWLILTKDAHSFYEKFKFKSIKPSNYMELLIR